MDICDAGAIASVNAETVMSIVSETQCNALLYGLLIANYTATGTSGNSLLQHAAH